MNIRALFQVAWQALVRNAFRSLLTMLGIIIGVGAVITSMAIGSGAQIGLFVAPVLVLLSFAVGPSPLAMVFNVYEIAALLIAGLVCSALVSDGESTWFEGFQLIALYAVIGIIFFAA